MVLKCPLCGRKFSSLWCLKSHVVRKHPLNGDCPVCGRHFRNLVTHFAQEARKKGDLKHAVFYVLYHRCNCLRTPETYRRYVSTVVETLEEEVV